MSGIDYGRDVDNDSSSMASNVDEFAVLDQQELMNQKAMQSDVSQTSHQFGGKQSIDAMEYTVGQLSDRMKSNLRFSAALDHLDAGNSKNSKDHGFAQDQKTIAAVLNHYSEKDHNGSFKSDDIRLVSKLVETKGSHQVINDVEKQVQAEIKSDRNRLKAMKLYLGSDSASINPKQQTLAFRALRGSINLNEHDQQAIKYQPGQEGRELVMNDNQNSASNSNATVATEASATSQDQGSQSASSASFFKQFVHAVKNEYDQLKGPAMEKYHRNMNNFRSQLSKTDYQQRMKVHPDLARADRAMSRRYNSHANAYNSINNAVGIYHDAQTPKDKSNAKLYVASVLMKSDGKRPDDSEAFKSTMQDLNKNGVYKTANAHLDKLDDKMDDITLRQNALETAILNPKATAGDFNLAHQALKKQFTPTVDQAQSQAAYLGFDPKFAGEVAFKKTISQANSIYNSDGSSSNASKNEVTNAMDANTQNSSAAFKNSKAVHENSGLANDGQSQSNPTNFEQSGDTQQFSTNSEALGLGETALRTEELSNSKKEIDKTPKTNSKVEKQAETESDKFLDDDALDHAAGNAANVHEKVDGQQMSTNKRRNFLQRIKDSWKLSQRPDEKQTAGSMFMKGVRAGGRGAVIATSALAYASLAIAGATAVGATHLVKKGAKKFASAFDKSVARGFAPGDAKSSGLEK